MSTEYGVCEAGAVRDVLAGNFVLPSYDPFIRAQEGPQYSTRMPREGEWGRGGMVQVPPLYWWLAALVGRALGMTSFALRLPSIVAACVLCALLYWWIATVLDRSVALFALLVVMLSQFPIEAAMAPRMDMLLAMFVTGACFFFERAFASEGSERPILLWVAAICVGLGSLAKGPIGAILPALVVGIYLLVGGQFRSLFRQGPALALGGGFCVWLAWFALAYGAGGDEFFRYQIVEGIFRRALPESMGGAGSCRYPPYEYVQILMGQMLPWSLLLPSLMALLVERRAIVPAPMLFSLVFFLVVFGFFTLSSGRCPIYVLPCVGPFAALISYLVFEVVRHRQQLSSVTTLLFSSACCLAAISMLLFSDFALLTTKYGVPLGVLMRLHASDHQLVATVASLLPLHSLALAFWWVTTSIGAFASLRGVVRSNSGWTIGGVVAISLASAFFWFHELAPDFSAHESFRAFANEVDALVPRNAVIEFAGRPPPCDLRFYLVHQISPSRMVNPAPHDGFFLLREDDLRRLNSFDQNKFSVVAHSNNASPTMLAEFLVEGRYTPLAFRNPSKRNLGSAHPEASPCCRRE